MKKIIVFCVVLAAVAFFLGQDLNPLDPHLFSIHDSTQAARMQEFALNIQHGIIPPRVAPNFSFQHGFPVFNFYAPFTYWIGGLLHVVGFSTALSLKLVLFGGLLASFICFFLFASLFFGFWGGLLGATVYSSSLWMAVEIFVRGNVGEIWFMALFPLALYFLKRNDAENRNWLFLLSCVVLSFLFTVHNVLSLVSVPIIIVFSLLLKKRGRALLSLLIGLLLSASFLLPAVMENKLTYASEIASRTKYTDHFLCIWQLWRADKWSFGGSGIGCYADDMSFQIGKIHLLLAGLGLGIFALQLFMKKKIKEISIFIAVLGLTLFSVFLTLDISRFFWALFAPIMAIFQFPWRFLPFVLFGVSFFAANGITFLNNKKIIIFITIASSLTLLYTSSKFFTKPWKFTLAEYTDTNLSVKYIETKAAYEIPEYFPRTGSYKEWRKYDKNEIGFYTNPLQYKINTPFYKEILTDQNQVTLPIHYFPFWEIKIDGTKYTPQKFDSIGRPIVDSLPIGSVISVRYNETPVEKVGNTITVVTFLLMLILILSKKIWKKTITILQ